MSFWEEIGANSFILNTIKEGYKIPFVKMPKNAAFKNNKSALRNRKFVEDSIKDLLKTGRLIKLKAPPFVVNPLSVSEKGEKKRLILDLRYVNGHIRAQHVKFENFKVFRNYLQQGSYMFNFDFRHGYHHVEICKEHRGYLGFSWTKDGKISYYCFPVLPFGLSSAGHNFTKVCRCLVKYWRSNGIKIVIFLDDGIGCEESLKKFVEASQFVRTTILKSGFIINESKSSWSPNQQMVWLGLKIDTANFILKSNKNV